MGRPAATPRSLPFLHKHRSPSKESATRQDVHVKEIDEEEEEEEGETAAVNGPFGPLEQSPWRFGG